MIHSGAATDTSQGFVTIETAERIRRNATLATFKAGGSEPYDRALSASVALKSALQAWEQARIALADAAAVRGVHVGDLIDSIEIDARDGVVAAALGAGLRALSVSQTVLASQKSSKRAA